VKRINDRSAVNVSLPYRIAIRSIVPLVPLFARDAMSRRAHAGRLNAPARLAEWAEAHRDPLRPLVWIHAASVGEGLQAREVLTALRKRRPDLQAIATRFSASAERLAESMPAESIEYIPYDRRRDVDRALEALRPDLLVFAKLDLWPQLTTRAAARGVRLALVAGSVDPASARLAWPARVSSRPGYAALERIAANSTADADRLVRLGAIPSRITVVGDPRIDSVLAIIDRLAIGQPDGSHDTAAVLVAGSTWPADESVLLEALEITRASHPTARMVIVPHEPTPEHCHRLEVAATGRGLSTARWSGEGGAATAAVTIVDRLGVLLGLYPTGDVAYVGGGFGQRGVHSVVEPAAWGRPVLIGPRDRGSREAELLADAGALRRLPTRNPAHELAATWCAWLAEPSTRLGAAAAARRALERDRGAAERSAAILADLLPAPR
jgi:3-deoxy-D-manno-octulosonic-acid transferase